MTSPQCKNVSNQFEEQKVHSHKRLCRQKKQNLFTLLVSIANDLTKRTEIVSSFETCFQNDHAISKGKETYSQVLKGEISIQKLTSGILLNISARKDW